MHSQSVFSKNMVKGENIIRVITLVNFDSKSKREFGNVVGELEEMTMVLKSREVGWSRESKCMTWHMCIMRAH